MNQLPIIERAASHSSRSAIGDADGSQAYADLLTRSADIAVALLNNEADLNEAHIAYLLPAGSDYVAVQWGIWRAGAVAVPLSQSATESELEYTLTDSEAKCLVTTSQFVNRVQTVCSRLDLRMMITEGVEQAGVAELPKIDISRRAMILYTSGTTSKPKGVVTTHECIQAQIESLIEAWHWQAEDRIPLFLPLHHIHGIINIMSCALWSGAYIEAFSRFDMDTILQRVAEKAYSVFMAVPTIYVKMIQALESMTESERSPIIDGFAQMRLMISGSAALPASVHEQWTALTGQMLLERYGMTEIGMGLSNPYLGERRPGAVGLPLPGVKVRLQSEADQTVITENEAGEIQVRGANVFLEYWNRSDATKEAFHNGWFRTGDMAILEDGYYCIMGRSSVDIIKSGGYKLSALEIEAALLDHPAICECAVVGLPDDTWGEAVSAAVVLADGETLDLEILRSWCRDRVSVYKIPQNLVTVDQLPRNAMGKVTKPAVVKLF
jgi:malonyl-CoA/methylmalonyl-CoA synthetase